MRGARRTKGVDAVVVSNHGGRQLDCVSADDPRAAGRGEGRRRSHEVLLDGGIRRGGDVVKALCLGARAVLIGRAYAYGLGDLRSGPGVGRSLDILRADMHRTMKLLGCPSVTELNRSYVSCDKW